MRNKYNLIFLVGYLLVLLSFLFIKTSPENKVILYIINSSICFIIYSAFYYRNRNKQSLSLSEILITAVILRVILIFVNPITSVDIYRYLWDGLVQGAGINPYQFAPQDTLLFSYQSNPIYANVSFPDVRTIYPPLAQILFFLNHVIFGESIIGLKLLYLLIDVGIIIFIYKILKTLNYNTNSTLLYALSPLILFELFINAHIDILLLFFLAISIYFVTKNNVSLAFLFLGFSALSKIYSLMFLPIYILYFYNKEDSFKKIFKGFLFLIISFSPILIYVKHFSNIFLTIENYSRHWYFNNLLFKLTVNAFLLFGISDHQITRIIFVAIFLTALLIILFSKLSFIKKISLTIISYFLFSHTVHPWYLVILVLLLTIYFQYSSFFWSGFIVLTNLSIYYYIKYSVWGEVKIILILEYLLLFVFIIIDFKKNIFKKHFKNDEECINNFC